MNRMKRQKDRILKEELPRSVHRRQPTRLLRPWDSPGKNTGMGCHFFLQCMKVKSESEVAQSCLTLCNPMDYTVHRILQARILEWVACPFSSGSSRPRNRTGVSSFAGRFFMLSHCFSCVLLCATLWTVGCQAPQSMGFSRQEYWSGLSFPSPGESSRCRHQSLISSVSIGG